MQKIISFNKNHELNGGHKLTKEEDIKINKEREKKKEVKKASA